MARMFLWGRHAPLLLEFIIAFLLIKLGPTWTNMLLFTSGKELLCWVFWVSSGLLVNPLMP